MCLRAKLRPPAQISERAGFPKLIDGAVADNDPTRYFHGGTHLQRAALTMVNNIVYAGFGGHCDKYNFTGWVIGVDKATAEIKATFATESGAFAPAQDGTFDGGGGGGGIWMSGMSISSDSPNRLFYVTGNGEGHQNREVPASGRAPLGTLDETIVNMKIDPVTGKLSLQDYFEPYEYIVSYGLCGGALGLRLISFSQWMLEIVTWVAAASHC